MQAIQTKYMRVTGSKGARIKAECERGSLTISWDYALNADENHVKARQAMCEKFAEEDNKLYGTPLMHSSWLKQWHTGTLKDGSFVHVQRWR